MNFIGHYDFKPDTPNQKLALWLKGDAEAIRMICDMWDAIEFWDDLIDRDKEPTPRTINNVFMKLFVSLPRNAFYRKHFDVLNPVLESSIHSWMTANELEKEGGEEELRISHVLRCSYMAIVVMTARIIGGNDWASKVYLEITHVTTDPWSEYAAGHGVK